MTTPFPPVCNSCIHRGEFVETQASYPCDVFGVVPLPILLNQVDHRQPVEGDSGVTFEQDPRKPVLDDAFYDRVIRTVPAPQ